MPVGIKTIISTRAKNKGEEVKVQSYYFEPGMKPLAVIVGCFSPFTGKNGHGRLLAAAKAKGINDFVIIIPGKDVAYDENRNMFNNKQKLDIAMRGAKELGYNVIDGFVNSETLDPYRLLRGVAAKHKDRRIVMVCGPDREADYSKYCVPYSKSYVASLDDGENGPSKFEYIVLPDRGENATSGTKVRETIRNNDAAAFMKLTGYSKEMWEWVHGMATKNAADAKNAPAEEKQMIQGARRGIKHLYNPGNAAELDAAGFLELVQELNKTGGILKNDDNINITEKADGTSFAFGLDDKGQFFTMKSKGAPRYSSKEIIDRCLSGTELKQGKAMVTVDALNTAKMFKKLEVNKTIRQILKDVADEMGSAKITCEMMLTGSGMKSKDGSKIRFVGTEYDTEKLGKFGTLVVIKVSDAFDTPYQNQKTVIDELVDCSNEDLVFDTTRLDGIKPINIKKPLKQINDGLAKLNDEMKAEGTTLTDIFNNKDRSKAVQQLKKHAKEEVNKLQKVLNDALDAALKDVGGKWGEQYEGRVFGFNNGQMVKITSSNFKDFKSSHSLDFLDNKSQEYEGDWEKELNSIKERKMSMRNFTAYLFEHTRPMLNEKFVGKNLVMYNSSKDDSFEKYFNSHSLRFANNAGNMYGLGIYTVLEMGDESGTHFSDKFRNSLYGAYTYEIVAPSDTFFYFLYDYFVKSALFDKCGSPSEQDFIKAQFEYFKIKMPSKEQLEKMTPSESNRVSSCAFNFYKYMHDLYYQRKDGTLNCPITGFVYFGNNDGYVGVIWAPYRCKLTRKMIDGKWHKIEAADHSKFDDDADDTVERIFDGNKTPEKVKVYKLLQAYKGENVPLGIITNIVIHDDKTFDFTFKANNPQADGYRHCYIMMDNPYMDEIFDMGYRIGTLDGWAKFGMSSQAQNKEGTMYMPSNAPKNKIPARVTGGIYLTGMSNIDAKEIKACKRIKAEDDTLVIRKSTINTPDLGFKNVQIKDSIIADRYYDEIVDKYTCTDDEGTLRVKSASQQKQEEEEKAAAKRAKEEAKRAKEEEKARKAAEREAKKKAKEEEAAAKAAAKAAKAK